MKKGMSKRRGRKVVGRGVAIFLVVLCVAITVFLGGVILSYQSVNANLQQQINALNAQITSLEYVVNLLNTTVWVDSQIISQPSNSYTNLTSPYGAMYFASYAGYVSVNVTSSTTASTYVEVIYTFRSSEIVNFDQKIVVGTKGTAVFPILPAQIGIRVGNTDMTSGATETVTVTYHY